MSKIWIISDTHFAHANILTFKKKDGTLVRPGFNDVQDMDDYMVKQWNGPVLGVVTSSSAKRKM